MAITKRREIIPTEQYSAVLEELSKKIPSEDESDALYLDREATEHSYQGTDSDVQDNLVHKEYSDSISSYYTEHLILLYHKNKVVDH
ncbi:hypothetical protein AVEN_136876-1 [Araneus ventricosus]|uniref:Uncharacterized protein n=1 Tax=Araneus ventricosus TaxID=182803 RepID=A0A4Y2JP92_ARAVE|nr:hypothetical protein AVEN_136876-1 [Araneus ventricosus]